ncbi:LysR family transcriptional regulator [Agrobacterium rhizogenes]|nr:LysR family transcriptional regulator [Rhizobium rhizogenes]NTH98575.1 LysR family transcriptional regulator [Rhizobium rhizogenes]NTJ16761.1 LysR family transcriptional regulator [Rhizobium rhizogenes]
MKSLTSIAAFVYAAEQQNYVAVARILGISPSAIAKAIVRLESHLGVRLFNRTTRSVSLTEEGALFYERCKHIINDLNDAEATIIQSRERPRGRLRVSVPHIVGHHLLMPILPVFAEKFPEIELDIDFEDHVVDLVTEGIDVVVRSGDLTDSGLIARPLGGQHFVICASPRYLSRHGRPETPSDLARHACIHFKYPSSGRIAQWAFAHARDRSMLPRSLTINNSDAALRPALDDMGLVHLPVYVARPRIEDGSLVPVLTSYMAQFGSLSLLWPSNRQLLPKVRAFVDTVIEGLGARPEVFQPFTTKAS